MQLIDYEEGMRLTETHVCGECGSPLVLPWGGAYGIQGYVIKCSLNPDHWGFTPMLSYTQLVQEGVAAPIEIANQVERSLKKQMKEKLGEEKTTALEPYRGITALTKAQASHVLATIWPEAPSIEVTKAAMLCASYGLNPLMRHVFLIPFKKKDGGKNWAIVLGIKAKRLMASRRCGYGYVDGPRIMTRQEQESILGEEDDKKLWSLTRLKNKDGLEAVGYGNWPKSEEPYGIEKGNSKANMAHIRSESAALDRLNPAEMPFEVEVMDDQFIEGDYKVVDVDEKTGEIKDTAPEDLPEHWCPIHNVPFFKKGKMKWWAHKIEGTDEWCSESAVMKQAKEVPPQKGDEKARRDTFLKLCKQHGWDHEEAEGMGEIASWVAESFGAKWLELTDSAQVDAIVAMRNMVEGATPEETEEESPEIEG